MRLTKAGRVVLKKILTPDENLDERALSRVRHQCQKDATSRRVEDGLVLHAVVGQHTR
jgi:hypothetical protein